jgi:hypothetical protein
MWCPTPPPPDTFPRWQQCVHGLHTLEQNYANFLLSGPFFHISKWKWFINVLSLLGVHGQFDVWAVYGVAVWCKVVLQSFSSRQMLWNGVCADLQFNNTLKMCHLPMLVSMHMLCWKVGLNSQGCLMAVGLVLSVAFCRHVVSCYLYRLWGNAWCFVHLLTFN